MPDELGRLISKAAAEAESKAREIIKDTKHGRVGFEIVIRNGRPEVTVEKIQTRIQ